MDEATMYRLARDFLAAWNSQEVEQVLACYTEDLVYTDPNTRGAVVGQEAMRRYLGKLFAAWTMSWSLREAHLLHGGEGCTVLWHATFRRAAGGPTVEADGMDLVLVRGDRIQRNDVLFDRSVLAAEHEQLKQFLLRGWTTHDAMWFKSALDELGVEVANRLNRSAIHAMAPIEVKRVLQALRIERVDSYDQLRTFMAGAMDLLGGDYFSYRWEWRPPDALRVDVQQCFAHKGIARLGAIDRYECGIFDRICAWFDALGVRWQIEPALGLCTMHHEGVCVRELRFGFGG